MILFETHIPVANTAASQDFYVNVLGLDFAYRDSTRDIVFLWIGAERRSMLGLWGPNTHYGKFHKCHFAMTMSLPDLLTVGERLARAGVPTRNFSGEKTTEPSVIGWMPSAQIYFSDLDGHSLEYICILDETPDVDFIGPYSAWQQRSVPAAGGS